MASNPLRAAARTIIAGSLLLGSAAASPAVFADDDDRFGTYLYAGTIDDLDNARVIEDIDELDDDDDDRDEHWAVLGDGQDMPEEFYSGDDDLDDDIDLDTLTSESHLIVVHETEDRDSPIVAVGLIDGEITGDTLLIQLDEHEGSGWEGRTWFGPDFDDDDDDDDDLDVVVGIYPTGEVEPLSTPQPVG